MALPRRPNLLALFPGISNDWQAAEGGGRERQTDRHGERQREIEMGLTERDTARKGRHSGRGKDWPIDRDTGRDTWGNTRRPQSERQTERQRWKERGGRKEEAGREKRGERGRRGGGRRCQWGQQEGKKEKGNQGKCRRQKEKETAGEKRVVQKTKTEMGLVTAMVGAAGLARPRGPFYSTHRRLGHSAGREGVGPLLQ